MLKSEKNKNAEKNATTSKFGKFFTHKKGIFFVSMLIHHLQNYFIQKRASTINLEYKTIFLKKINDHAKPVVCRSKFKKKIRETNQLSLNKHSHKNFLG
jgi:hypothetical protein